MAVSKLGGEQDVCISSVGWTGGRVPDARCQMPDAQRHDLPLSLLVPSAQRYGHNAIPE